MTPSRVSNVYFGLSITASSLLIPTSTRFHAYNGHVKPQCRSEIADLPTLQVKETKNSHYALQENPLCQL